MATTPSENIAGTAENGTETVLLLDQMKGKMPPARLAAKLEQLAGAKGVEEFEGLLRQLLEPQGIANSTEIMGWLVAARSRLAQFAQSLGCSTEELEEVFAAKKIPYEIAMRTAFGEHPEYRSNAAVAQLMKDFARRYATCASLGELCASAVKIQSAAKQEASMQRGDSGELQPVTPRTAADDDDTDFTFTETPSAGGGSEDPTDGDDEDAIASYLAKGATQEGETERQRRVRESTLPRAKKIESPAASKSVSPPQETAGVLPDGTIDFQEIPPEETRPGA